MQKGRFLEDATSSSQCEEYSFAEQDFIDDETLQHTLQDQESTLNEMCSSRFEDPEPGGDLARSYDKAGNKFNPDAKSKEGAQSTDRSRFKICDLKLGDAAKAI